MLYINETNNLSIQIMFKNMHTEDQVFALFIMGAVAIVIFSMLSTCSFHITVGGNSLQVNPEPEKQNVESNH